MLAEVKNKKTENQLEDTKEMITLLKEITRDDRKIVKGVIIGMKLKNGMKMN